MTSPCVSMACNFFLRTKGNEHAEARDAQGHKRPLDPHHFGAGKRARDLMLMRWMEEFIGGCIVPVVDATSAKRLGSGNAKKDGAVWGGPQKERAVAQWMVAVGRAAGARLVARGHTAEARGLQAYPAQQLPPLQEGMTFEMIEPFLRQRAALELGSERPDVVDAFMVKAVAARGFDRR